MFGLIFLLHRSPFVLISGVLSLLPVFGPTIGAVIVLKIPIKSIPKWLFSGKKGTWRYLLLFSGFLTAVTSLAASGRLVMETLPFFPLMAVRIALFGGGNEEPGWRGFLQPALEKNFSYPLATLIVGIIWAGWHLPLWGLDRGQSSFPIFILTCLLLSFVFSGLYKVSNSIIVCVLLHTIYNTLIMPFKGFAEVAFSGNYSQFNIWYYLTGLLLVASYGIWLWYRADQNEKKEKAYDLTMQ